MEKVKAIHELEDARDGYTEYLSNDAINMAIEALRQPEPKEELLDDGTLVIWTNVDMTKFSRVNVRQVGTHIGDMYYPDED